jgi:hypothetical protein
VRIDSTGDRLQVTISAPDIETGASTFRPTFLMERASRWLEAHPGEHSRTAVTEAVEGNKAALGTALDVLADEGYATVSETVRGKVTYRNYAHVRLFTEDADLAERTPVQPVPHRSHTGPGTGTKQTGPTGPPPYIGGPVTGTGTGNTEHEHESTHTGPVPVRDESAALQPCQTCGHPLSLGALSCPGCGELVEAPF